MDKLIFEDYVVDPAKLDQLNMTIWLTKEERIKCIHTFKKKGVLAILDWLCLKRIEHIEYGKNNIYYAEMQILEAKTTYDCLTQLERLELIMILKSLHNIGALTFVEQANLQILECQNYDDFTDDNIRYQLNRTNKLEDIKMKLLDDMNNNTITFRDCITLDRILEIQRYIENVQ